MAAPPRTSVILPAHDAAATLRESVESALAQTIGDIEVIVVDDGSPTPATTTLAGIRDERLRIIRHLSNRGVPTARNVALGAARAPLVSQLDADDAWEPDYLEHVLAGFEDPRVGLVYSNATVVGHPAAREEYVLDPERHPIDSFPTLAEANPIPATTVTMRRHAVQSVGGYATWLWGSTDYHLYLKLAAAGWQFAYVDRLLARYRWPAAERGMSFDRRRVARSDLKLWLAFGLRHPFIPLRRVRLYGRLLKRNLRGAD